MNTFPLVRLVSSTYVQRSEMISLNHLFSVSTMVHAETLETADGQKISVGKLCSRMLAAAMLN